MLSRFSFKAKLTLIFKKFYADAPPAVKKGTGDKLRGKGLAKEEKPPEKILEYIVSPGQVLTGLDIFSKQPPPTILPLESYPPWLFTDVDHIYGPKKSSSMIIHELESANANGNIGNLEGVGEKEMYELKRALKRENRRGIKMKNSLIKLKK